MRLFHMIHGVDSEACPNLQEQCDKQSRTARILLEVNVSGEVSKHGFTQTQSWNSLRTSMPWTASKSMGS